MMKNEHLKLEEIWVGSRQDKTNNIMRYLQENAAAISVAFTVAIAIGGLCIKLLYYLMGLGRLLYFEIPKSSIDIFNGNVFYRFIVDGLIALFLILLNLIPYFIWANKDKTLLYKIIRSIVIVSSPNILILIGYIIDLSNGTEYTLKLTFAIFAVGLIFGLLFFSMGLYYGIKKYRSYYIAQKETNIKGKKITFLKWSVIIAFCIVIFLGCFVFAGYMSAASKNEFIIIDDNENQITYTVLYEKSESFIITECCLDDGYIYIDKSKPKKEINREGIEYRIVKAVQKQGD